jgi:uncharacterized protein YfeS
MIDLNKEAEAFLLGKGYKGFASHTLFPKFMAEFATQSKYVQSEKLKAQIEVMDELASADGTTSESWRIIMTDLKQQINQLENDNTTNTSS